MAVSWLEAMMTPEEVIMNDLSMMNLEAKFLHKQDSGSDQSNKNIKITK